MMLVSEKAKQLRYKKPALQMLCWESITDALYEITEQCDSVQWAMQDDDALLAALDDNEEEVFEFRMAFSDLSASAEQLHQALNDYYIDPADFNAIIVGLLGNKYNLVGFDSIEEDYFSLTRYESDLATRDAGQRLMRYTKPDMIAKIGHSLGISISFLDVKHKYDYLCAAFDILKEQDHSLLDLIKDIDAAYTEAEKDDFRYSETTKRFDMLLTHLPDKVWVE
jgi:hypothetical protein